MISILDLERVVKVGQLFSLYGSLLTDKQQEFVRLYYFNDLSLGEIAEQKDISRQAVYDNLQRSEKALTSYEEKLELTNYYKLLAAEIDNLKTIVANIRPKLETEELRELEAVIERLETYYEGEL